MVEAVDLAIFAKYIPNFDRLVPRSTHKHTV
jgi:hypothetical protein